jgi:hypothetical protein
MVTLAIVSGCAVGPDFERPPAPDVQGYMPEPLAARTASAATSGGQAQRFVRDLAHRSLQRERR